MLEISVVGTFSQAAKSPKRHEFAQASGTICCTNVGTIADPVDGVGFWARGDAPIRFIAATAETQRSKSGGRCTEGCYDHHGQTFALEKEWKHFAFRWSDLTQQGYGKQVPFSKRVLFSGFAQVERKPFEFWVADLTHFIGEPPRR